MKRVAGPFRLRGIYITDLSTKSEPVGDLLHQLFPLRQRNGAECSTKKQFCISTIRVFGLALQHPSVVQLGLHPEFLQSWKGDVGRGHDHCCGFIVGSDERVFIAKWGHEESEGRNFGCSI